MKKAWVAGVFGVIAIAGAAQAGELPGGADDFYTECVEWDFPLSPGKQTLQLPKFDTNDGLHVLKLVHLSWEGSMSANVTAENDSEIAAPEFSVGLTGLVNLDINGGTVLGSLGFVRVAGPVAVAASDGVPDMGPDFHDFGLVSDTDFDSTFEIPAAVWLAFPDTFDVQVTGSGGFAVSGSADSSIMVSNFRTSGEVCVTYYYNIIPTPGAFGLAGLTGLALLRRRR